ncbi:hypothetical protein HC251_10545 [Iamia sp. SCSIO 61187]|uniref:hypothetical protein n=1 Tax=Iamia sp. SCSIO 61187 TaxID=2722752 RepID=UPI001C638853|nr:hypothetical protein [Iamia sp. SCSIO 61187]QYG92824.1 hypothetical protein HC251_10545 [Iamia sp. SCSIO 61187]
MRTPHTRTPRAPRPTRTMVVSAVAVFVGLSIGVAAALWSSDATGGGQAEARTAETVTVAAATGTADLYPGFTDGDLTFTLDNDNPYPITFTSADAGTVTSSDEAGCPASLVTVDDATGLELDVAAEATTATLTVADVVSLDVSAEDECQGVVFSIELTLSGSQV